MAKRNERSGATAVRALIVAACGIVAVFFIVGRTSKSANERRAREAAGLPAAAATAAPALPYSGPGYVLRFSDDFNPGANAIDDLGLSVVIAVDVSGSMAEAPASGGEPKHVQAARALSGILSFLERLRSSKALSGMRFRVAVIAFHEEIRTVFPLADMDAAAFERARAAVSAKDALAPGGRTSIGGALEVAAELLAGSGTVMKSVIVVSDGANTSGKAPEEVLFAINENRVDRSTVDLPVITRGTLVSFVGFDVDAGLYSAVEAEGARIESAADRAGLERALESILVADISRLEAAQ